MSERESLSASLPVPVTEHWDCPFCGSLMALAITPGSRHPDDGVWACPTCFRVRCDACDREARHHAWAWVNDHGMYRVEGLFCGRHMAGQRRRTWGGMRESETVEAFFRRCGWRTPIWLRKHAITDGHVSYVEFREDWLGGLYQAGCTCAGRCCRGHETPRAAGDDALHHLSIVRELAHA